MSDAGQPVQPVLTESRALDTAIEWIHQTRTDRNAFVDRCHSELGIIDIRDLVESGNAEFDLHSLRLLPILEALPAAGGKVASRRSMDAAGLAHDTICGDVPAEAWNVLIGRLVAAKNSEDST